MLLNHHDSIFAKDYAPSLCQRLHREGVPDAMADMALRCGLEGYLATRLEVPLGTGVELVVAQAENSLESPPPFSSTTPRPCDKVTAPGGERRCNQEGRKSVAEAMTASGSRSALPGTKS